VKERLRHSGCGDLQEGAGSPARPLRCGGSVGVGIERIFPLHSPAISQLKWLAKVKCAGPGCITCAEFEGKAARIKRAAARKWPPWDPGTEAKLRSTTSRVCLSGKRGPGKTGPLFISSLICRRGFPEFR